MITGRLRDDTAIKFFLKLIL